MKKHLTIRVVGKVQGVFFRQGARDFALERGLVGFAKNESDGAVLIEAEGVVEELEKLNAWCNQGSEKADVESITVKYDEIFEDYHDFIIR